MQASPNGRKFIKSYEKCKLKAYHNHPEEPWTIGWGNTFYEDGAAVKEGDVISQDRADRLFTIALAMFERGVKRLVKRTLNQNQIDALISFAYNLGLANLKKSTLLKKINTNPNDPSIEAEFLRWVMPGSIFENGLRKRRQAEADLYFTPTQPS
jgi:lysozyme